MIKVVLGSTAKDAVHAEVFVQSGRSSPGIGPRLNYGTSNAHTELFEEGRKGPVVGEGQ